MNYRKYLDSLLDEVEVLRKTTVSIGWKVLLGGTAIVGAVMGTKFAVKKFTANEDDDQILIPETTESM